MLLFLSLLGLVLSIILLTFNAGRYRSAIYLGCFFLLVSLYGFIQYVLFYSHSVFLISICYINIGFLCYLTGPMLFWYVRSVLTDNSSWRQSDFWHVLPALFFFLSVLPYVFTPYSHKIETATHIAENVGFIAKFRPSLLSPVFSNAILYLSRPVLVLLYAFWSLGMIARFILQKRESSVFIRQKYMVLWLVVLLGFLLILSISHLILISEAFSNQDAKLFFTLNLLQVSSAVGLAGLLVSPFFFPGILYGLPRLPGQTQEENALYEEVYLSNVLIKKRIPNYEAEYIDLITQKLHRCMSERQLYLLGDCNMINVSKCINLPVHHIAYYFREIKKQSFNDYRNELRISHAKQLIREGKARELTLEGIALQSGFTTRNTFFNAFKKIEGETPSAFSAKFTSKIN